MKSWPAVALLPIALILAGCETPTTQRYAISADNNQAIKSLGVTNIGVAPFIGPANFSANCRALGPMQVADGLSHTQYIQKAFEDELKIAGAFAPSGARVVLSGAISRLEFSSTRAVTGGSWTIDLSLKSSNGQALAVNEYYEFSSGFAANDACRNTAEAFSRAVQDLIGKTIRSPGFAGLVTGPFVAPVAATSPIAPLPATQTAQPIAPVPTAAQIGVGKDSYSAERLAKEQSCSLQPTARLLAKGAGFETYSVACTTGDVMMIRCEFGACRTLK
jgi:hypothetical protein